MSERNHRIIKAFLSRKALFEATIDRFNEKEKILYNQVRGVLLSNLYDTTNAHNIALLMKGDPNPQEDFVDKVFHYGKMLGQLDEPYMAQLFSPTYIYTQTEANSPYFWFRRNSSGFSLPSFIPKEFQDLWHEALQSLKEENLIMQEDGSPNYEEAIKRYSQLLSERVDALERAIPLEEEV